MTRLKPRKRDKIIGIFSSIDKKFADREDPNIPKIKELEDQMDKEPLGGKSNLGINTQKNFAKRMNKTHKGLR